MAKVNKKGLLVDVEDIMAWLDLACLKNYSISFDVKLNHYVVHVIGDIDLENGYFGYEKLPVVFGEVTGNIKRPLV